jgi:hypothetical protein
VGGAGEQLGCYYAPLIYWDQVHYSLLGSEALPLLQIVAVERLFFGQYSHDY